MDIGSLSKEYSVIRMTSDNIDEIYELCRKNEIYYQWCPPLVTKQSVMEDLEALPPGKTDMDKYFIGFYKGQELIAIMDLIDGYPAEKIAFIGLFMTDVSVQNQGVGSAIIEDLCTTLRAQGYESIRLAWVKGNPQAQAFWMKLKFISLEETMGNVGKIVVYAEKLLNES